MGLDIKALPEDYAEVTGRAHSGETAWRSLELVLASGVACEVRTTVAPASLAASGLTALAERLRELGVTSFAVQQARAEGARPEFEADRPGWDDAFAELANKVGQMGWPQLAIRTAR